MISKKPLIGILIILVFIIAIIIAGVILISSKNSHKPLEQKENQKPAPLPDFSQIDETQIPFLIREIEETNRKKKQPLKDFQVIFVSYPSQIKVGLNISLIWKIKAPENKKETKVKETFVCLTKKYGRKPKNFSDDCLFLSKTFSGKVDKSFSYKFKISQVGNYYAYAIAKIGRKTYFSSPVNIYVAK